MRKHIGSVRLPELETTLRYYIFGSRMDGYGVEIVQIEEDGSIMSQSQSKLTRRILEISTLARTLAQGIVFPDSLLEIVEDWDFSSAVRP